MQISVKGCVCLAVQCSPLHPTLNTYKFQFLFHYNWNAHSAVSNEGIFLNEVIISQNINCGFKNAFLNYTERLRAILSVIIQHIDTLSKYDHKPLDVRRST